jgi:hypothetical protein
MEKPENKLMSFINIFFILNLTLRVSPVTIGYNKGYLSYGGCPKLKPEYLSG